MQDFMGRYYRDPNIKANADPEMLLYIKYAAHAYEAAVEYCTRFESTKRSFIQRIGLDIHAFDTDDTPNPGVFKICVNGKENQKMLNKYLAYKELIYILDHAIQSLLPDDKEIANMFLKEHLSGKEVANRTGRSEASVCRQKRIVLNAITRFAMSYFAWKCQMVGYWGSADENNEDLLFV